MSITLFLLMVETYSSWGSEEINDTVCKIPNILLEIRDLPGAGWQGTYKIAKTQEFNYHITCLKNRLQLLVWQLAMT